jgi:hypothetical protein
VLRDERGQSIVLFVVTTTALMGLLALVLNVGYWLESRRHLRAVADATAMEAAQSDHDTFEQISVDGPNAAQNIATANWEGSALTQYQYINEGGGSPLRDPTKTWLRVRVTTEHEVGHLAQNMLAFLGVDLAPFIFSSTAETTIMSPVTLKQVAPIAIACGAPDAVDCERPWPGWDGSPADARRVWRSDDGTGAPPEIPFEFDDNTQVELRYRPDPANLGDSSWMPVQRFPGATELDVQSAIQSCDPSDIDSPSCDQTEISTPSTQVAMDYADATAIYDALNNAGDWPQLVPVYDTYAPGAIPGDPLTPGELDIVGFAAFTIEDVEQPNAPLGPVIIRGTFHKMFFHLAQTPGGGTDDMGGEYDFGVRTIGLTGPELPPG